MGDQGTVHQVDFGTAEEANGEPIPLEQKYEMALGEIRVLRGQLTHMTALLGNREWLTARVIKLLNSERRGLYLIAAGAVAAMLLAGGGLGVKAVYDAAHRPAEMVSERTVTRSEPIFIRVPAPSPSPSPSASPSPTTQPVSVVRQAPPPSPPLLPPLPSPSPPIRLKHCPPPPDVPPRCLPLPSPLPTPPL